MATPPNVTLRPPSPDDAEALCALLTRNRDHFRTGEPLRPDAFYTVEAQRIAIELALQDAADDRAAVFLVEEDGELVGRTNLNSIIRGAFQSASVGYVVDQHHTGRGVATAALRLLVDEAFGPMNLHRLQAEVLPTNLASQRVLARCGFEHYGTAPQYLRIQGRWQPHELFQLINTAWRE